MTQTTARFGFNKFGGSAGGAISSDGFKFSTSDRDVLDRILAAFETGMGTGPALADPSAGPDATLVPGDGVLGGGQAFYYRISYIDVFGLETKASDEFGMSTPAPLTVPTSVATRALAGGTLVPGVYQYGVTVTSDDGGESTMSPLDVITLLADRGTIEIDVPALPTGGVTMYLYRKSPGQSCCAGRLVRMCAVTPGATYTDDGSVIPTGENAPTSNTTNGRNKITVSVPAADVELVQGATVRAWRLYRTNTPGVYPDSSLVHEVVETDSEGSGLLVTSYTDDGSDLLPGVPPERSQTIKPPAGVNADSGGGVKHGRWLPATGTALAWEPDNEGAYMPFGVSTSTVVPTGAGFTHSWAVTTPAASATGSPNFQVDLLTLASDMAHSGKPVRMSFWYALPSANGGRYVVALRVETTGLNDHRTFPGQSDADATALDPATSGYDPMYETIVWADGIDGTGGYNWHRVTVTLPPFTSSAYFDQFTTAEWTDEGDESSMLHVTGFEFTEVDDGGSDGTYFVEESTGQVWLYDTKKLDPADASTSGTGWYPMNKPRIALNGIGEIDSASVARYCLQPTYFAQLYDIGGHAYGKSANDRTSITFSCSIPETDVSAGTEGYFPMGYAGIPGNPYMIAGAYRGWLVDSCAIWIDGDPTSIEGQFRIQMRFDDGSGYVVDWTDVFYYHPLSDGAVKENAIYVYSNPASAGKLEIRLVDNGGFYACPTAMNVTMVLYATPQ